MSVIQTHDVTLYGGDGQWTVVLRPLTDADLPLLYKWNADPEVLYWTEGGTNEQNLSYTPETVRSIFGGVSQSAFCFLIEANGVPVGECWLQKMNIPDVLKLYDKQADVRRIDMSIGEKTVWNRGLGTQFIRMMVDFAFNGEHVDVLHCFCEDYNNRSRRMWEKQGFTCVLAEELPQPQKGKYQYHYRLTRQEYFALRRHRPAEEAIEMLSLTALQPSQLFISEGKLRNVREWFDACDKGCCDAIPVKEFMGRRLMVDGHTRAVAAYLAGWNSVPIYYDRDDLDMEAYATNFRWCIEEGIFTPCDLAARIVSHREYELLWRKRCL